MTTENAFYALQGVEASRAILKLIQQGEHTMRIVAREREIMYEAIVELADRLDRIEQLISGQ